MAERYQTACAFASGLQMVFYQVKTDTNSLAGMSCLKGACFLPESLQVIRATSATGSPGLPIASLIDYASHPVCANYISSFIQMVCRFI
jgi:hypothetical protein